MDSGTTIFLKGISRNPYTFTINPCGSKLPSASAVYAVLTFKQPGYKGAGLSEPSGMYCADP